MIAELSGTILRRRPPWLWLDVGGVGYELEMPLSSFYRLPADGVALRLYTHLQVREDAQALYGFLRDTERDLFRLLIRVSGIGGKVALACLAGMDADDLRRTIRDGEIQRLMAIPGIGRKTAERLVLELKDKLGAGADGDKIGATPAGDPREEAAAALLTLGYKPAQAHQAIGRLPDDLSVEDYIRQALQALARG